MVNTLKFEKLLKDKRTQLLDRLKTITKDKTRRDGPLDPDFEEQATMLENVEVVDRLDDLERRELMQIDAALQRIKDKDYGVCSMCQEEIGEKRLTALPYATTCVNCVP